MSHDGFVVICDYCGVSFWTSEVKPVNLCSDCKVPPDLDDVEPLPFADVREVEDEDKEPA